MELPLNSNYLKGISFFLISITFLNLPVFHVFAQEKNWILSSPYDENAIKATLISRDEWTPFPKSGNAFQQSLPDSLILQLIKKGEDALSYSWPSLKASQFLEFNRTGNRSNYQDEIFERRNKLQALVLAEMLEGKSRFVDEIVNGIWLICEESYWGVPAHLYLQKGNKALPNIIEPTVDLFAAQTANLLAWTDYLLGEQLDRISPRIRERIRIETERRILEPNMERDDFWWMGYENGGRNRVNNWNPWIASNWLSAVLLLEDNEEKRAAAVYKIMVVLDNYLNPFPEDGGCDEGPSYWGHAAASLFDCLELLYSSTDGKINIYNHPLIKNMGSYIYKVYIGENYFINFADAPAKLIPKADLIYRYGKRIEDVQMQQFGAYLSKNNDLKIEMSMDRTLSALLNYKNLVNETKEYAFQLDTWFAESEIMAARSNIDNKSFYIAAKGGNNAESHNHNDVGHFIVYYNAKPILVDAGVGTYTAKTFSNKRYEIWNMQSAYHNLPTVNGEVQVAGMNFKSSDVSYKSNTRYARFSLNLDNAYPEKSEIKSWKRTIQLNRGKNVALSDKFTLNAVNDTTFLSLITPCEVKLTEPGEIRLIYEEGDDKFSVYINYSASNFKVVTTPVNLSGEENEILRKVWVNGLNRIKLIDTRRQLSGNWKFLISSY
ncbi:MAG: heparinase II/III family protein [Bacteroidota bacterium]